MRRHLPHKRGARGLQGGTLDWGKEEKGGSAKAGRLGPGKNSLVPHILSSNTVLILVYEYKLCQEVITGALSKRDFSLSGSLS